MRGLLSLLLCGTAAALPTFPTEWNADTTQKIMLWQGGVHKADGSACCDKTAASCKIQAQAQNGKRYHDAANNRTLLSNGQSAVISLYAPINKQMSAVPSTSGKGWTCSEYCPLDDDYFDPLTLGKGTKDIGTATVNGKTVEQYQWFDRLIIIKMDENDLYVDQSGASPVPVLSVQKITPFGGAEIAEESSTYGGFISGASDPSIFAVDNLATCELSQQCNQNAKTHSVARRGAALLTARTQRTLAELAQEFVDKEEKEGKAAAIAVDAPATNSKVAAITWPKDWIAGEASSMLINQGGQVSADGSQICCANSDSGQCQIQSQFLSGTRYYDASNNRTRFEDAVNGVTVDDHNVLKSMLVQHNGTHDVCVKYCPIDSRDTMDVGRNYFIDPNATDMGTAQFNGQTAEHFQWKDKFLKIITMQINDFYISLASNGAATPLGEIDQLTPFGQHLGTSGLNYTSFTIGSPPVEKFNIQGVDVCPMDQGCNAPPQQAYFKASKLHHTFARSLKML